MIKMKDRFGKLVVVGYASPRSSGHGHRYTCVCDCGNTTIVLDSNLTTGKTRSCGCIRQANLRKKLWHVPPFRER